MAIEKHIYLTVQVANNLKNFDQFKDSTSGSYTNEHAVKGFANPNPITLPDNTTTKRCPKHMCP
jgi:hypothetical protein